MSEQQVLSLANVKDMPTPLQTKDVFQPRISVTVDFIERNRDTEYDKIFIALQKIAGAVPTPVRMFTDILPGGALEIPDAEYVVAPDFNVGYDVTHNGVKYEYIGFFPIIQCNVYRNPNSSAVTKGAGEKSLTDAEDKLRKAMGQTS